jgi:hypothetical protein
MPGVTTQDLTAPFARRGRRPRAAIIDSFLPTLAAKLFDPASKHKLVGVQDALREFHK